MVWCVWYVRERVRRNLNNALMPVSPSCRTQPNSPSGVTTPTKLRGNKRGNTAVTRGNDGVHRSGNSAPRVVHLTEELREEKNQNATRALFPSEAETVQVANLTVPPDCCVRNCSKTALTKHNRKLLLLDPGLLAIAREFGIKGESQPNLYVCKADLKHLEWIRDNRVACSSFSSAAGMLAAFFTVRVAAFNLIFTVHVDVCGMADSFPTELIPVDVQVWIARAAVAPSIHPES
jgi:hypothetical protein